MRTNRLTLGLISVLGACGTDPCSRDCGDRLTDSSIRGDVSPACPRADVYPPTNAFLSPTGGRYVLIDVPDESETPGEDIDRLPRRKLFIGATEVSNAEYRQFRPDHRTSHDGAVDSEAPDAPVGGVGPEDASAFAAWLTDRDGARTYRLPSEREWEAAARAGDGEVGWWSVSDTELVRYANVRDTSWGLVHAHRPRMYAGSDGFPGAAPVGSLRPNPWGLHDILGNAWELCLPTRGDSREGTRTWARGGSYADGPTVHPGSRLSYLPQPPSIGFRLVAVARK